MPSKKRMKNNTLKNPSNNDGSIDDGPGRPDPDQQLSSTLSDGRYYLQLQIRKILDTKL